MAFACAVEPLAFKVFLPPQLTCDADEPAVGDEPAVAVDPDVAVVPDDEELLLLPHADNISEPAASTPSAAPNRLSFT
jgi:hypothetical protein